MDLVDARKQLTFGAQAGRMELVCEAVEHLRGHNSYYLASVINGAATNRRMDMLEGAWQEYLAHPRRYRHTGQDGAEAVSPEEEMAIGALGNITGTLLFAAMKATDWPELVDWAWARHDTQPLHALALRRAFSGILADVRWTADGDYDDRFPDLSALSRFHELVPFQAASLLWSAIEPDRVDLVEWCAERSDPTCWDVLLMGSALSQKRLDLARWFHAHGVPYMVEPKCTGTTDLCSCEDCYCHEYAVLTSATESGDLAIPHGGIAACTGEMRISVLATAAGNGYLPLLEWLVDVAGLDCASDISLITECAAQKGRLNVLWWLVHERGWSIRVTDHHQPLWQRQLRPYEDQQPEHTQENEQQQQQQQEPATEAREIMLRRDIPGQSAIAAQWLINAGFWGGEPPKSLTSLPCY